MSVSAVGFSQALINWHGEHGRHDLPWQLEPTPYRVWVSEIMLQQTQVATVIPYYERFIARFPTLAELAAASMDDVLAHWSGLGYYARARNLHRAARNLIEANCRDLPITLDELMGLPGIGRSTAGAILALARGERFAILDGNVKRVFSRFHAVPGWPGHASVQKRLWELTEAQLPVADVAAYTQAVMDLGATICTRARPRCDDCPLSSACAALAAGSVTDFPEPRPKRKRPLRQLKVLAIENSAGEILLERRVESGIWGGLLSLPELNIEQKAEEWCKQRFGAAPIWQGELDTIEHGFTHFELRLKPVHLRIDATGAVMDDDRWLWHHPARTVPGGIAAPIAKLLRRLTEDTRQIA